MTNQQVNPTSSSPTPFFSNRVYDVLKWIAMIFIPAVATLYFALSQIWGFPNGSEVVGSLTAFDIFLGAILSLSTRTYNSSDARFDGAINIATQNDTKMFSLDLNTHPNDIESKDAVTFKVNSAATPDTTPGKHEAPPATS